MNKSGKCTFSIVVLVLAFATTALAQGGTYTTLNYPGAIYTWAAGINNAGEIVGYYQNNATQIDGFLLSNGTYTNISYPGAADTTLTGINDSGQITGYTFNPSVGFLYDSQTQSFTKMSYAGQPTYPFGINDAGTVTGYATVQGGASYSSFVESKSGEAHRIQPPGATATQTFGISNSGIIVGASNSATYLNFAFQDGKYQPLQFPWTYAGLNGISEDGTKTAGWWEKKSGSAPHGFVQSNKTYIVLVPPGAMFSEATGVNDNSNVVGYFEDSSGWHGFIWVPSANSSDETQR
jgi:hypothetical protein